MPFFAQPIASMAQSFDQRFCAWKVEFLTKIRNMCLDDVRMVFPIEVVEMFEKLSLRYNRTRAMN
jgi:hypothetical protein